MCFLTLSSTAVHSRLPKQLLMSASHVAQSSPAAAFAVVMVCIR